MVYPLFLLGMGGLIVTLMLAFFVPRFQPIFDGMAERGQLPWATTTLMSLSDGIKSYGVLGLIGATVGGVLLVRSAQTDAGRLRIDAFRLKAVGIGPIIRSLAIARSPRVQNLMPTSSRGSPRTTMRVR